MGATECKQQVIVGREPVEDERGEPTGEWRVMAQCNGGSRTDCGWSKRLDYRDNDPAWWITSDEMDELVREHREWRE